MNTLKKCNNSDSTNKRKVPTLFNKFGQIPEIAQGTNLADLQGKKQTEEPEEHKVFI